MLALADFSWDAFLSGPNAFILIGCAMVVVIVGLSLGFNFARERADAQLKQSMIERGMSVDEIERVIKARSDDK